MCRPDRNKGGVLAGVLAGILFLLALAFVAAFISAWYIARNVHVRKTATRDGRTVDIETPVGSMRVRKSAGIDPTAIGVPVYPGARASDRDSKLVDLDFDFGDVRKQVGIRAAEFHTPDSVDKVIQFYRRELPHWIVATKRHGGFEMKYSEEGYKRFIGIHERHDGTRIVIAQVSSDASN